MADVVEMIATLQNELAIELRDEGKIDDAQKVLMSNESYLRENFEKYPSRKLKAYAEQQSEDRMGLEKDEDWRVQRKRMRQEQSIKKRQ